ncbi:MAG: sugar phosphate isomerase/epimerase, partial [Candidatus Sulfotelmatobacter sp.]
MSRKNLLSRRDFVRSGALIAAACAVPRAIFSQPHDMPPPNKELPIRLGLASYTFRNFSRGQMIGFLKQLNVVALNAK